VHSETVQYDSGVCPENYFLYVAELMLYFGPRMGKN